MRDEIRSKVESPEHYLGSIECIRYIKSVLSPDQYIGYLRGNMIKYQHRLGKKDELELDVNKLAWYTEELKSTIEDQ